MTLTFPKAIEKFLGLNYSVDKSRTRLNQDERLTTEGEVSVQSKVQVDVINKGSGGSPILKASLPANKTNLKPNLIGNTTTYLDSAQVNGRLNEKPSFGSNFKQSTVNRLNNFLNGKNEKVGRNDKENNKDTKNGKSKRSSIKGKLSFDLEKFLQFPSFISTATQLSFRSSRFSDKEKEKEKAKTLINCLLPHCKDCFPQEDLDCNNNSDASNSSDSNTPQLSFSSRTSSYFDSASTKNLEATISSINNPFKNVPQCQQSDLQMEHLYLKDSVEINNNCCYVVASYFPSDSDRNPYNLVRFELS